MRIYLSPHLDDAVLSCGGTIHHHATAGELQLVISIFCREFSGPEPSPFAREQHRYWGDPPRPMALRRAEDLAALVRLGAEALHLDYLDAVYRAGPHGEWLYPDLQALFGDPHPTDPLLLPGTQGLFDRLTALYVGPDRPEIVAPLGVGHHVDHLIVHRAARRLLEAGFRVTFYEELPYAAAAGASEAALAAAGGTGWRAETIGLDASDLAAKVASLGYYRSQLGILFGGAEAMPNRIWSFAATSPPEGGLGEQVWVPTTG